MPDLDQSVTMIPKGKRLFLILTIFSILGITTTAEVEDKEDILDDAEATVNELSKASTLAKE